MIRFTLFIATLCAASGIASPARAPARVPAPVPAPVVKKDFKSWPNQAWATHAENEVMAQGLDKLNPSDAKEFCPNGMSTRNWVHLMGAMVNYESGFKPTTVYQENFTGRDGKFILSIGLFQVSLSSSNGGYGCGFKDNEDIKNPEKNISCGVKILKKLISQNGRIAGKVNGSWQGGARYFAVLRTPKVNEKSIPYLRKWCE